MELTWLWFTIASVAVTGLARLAGRTSLSFYMAAWLLGHHELSNLLPKVADPWIAAVGFYFACGLYHRQRSWWVPAIGALFISAILVNLFSHDLHPYYRQLALNVIFALQLLIVATISAVCAFRRHSEAVLNIRSPRQAIAFVVEGYDLGGLVRLLGLDLYDPRHPRNADAHGPTAVQK